MSTSADRLAHAASTAASLKHAYALQRQGQAAQAEAIYRQVLAQDPRQVEALQFLALFESQRQRHAEALALFDSALAARPDLALAWVNRGLSLQALGRVHEAIASHERALALQPGHPTALFHRAVLHHELGRFEDAIAGYDGVLRVVGHHAAAHCFRGVALQALGRHTESLAAFDRCLAVDPQHVDAQMHRTEALLALGRPAEALAAIDRVLADDPQSAAAHHLRGLVLQDCSRHAEARASHMRARERQPDHAEAQLHESLCALRLGDLAHGWPRFEWRLRQPRPIEPPRALAAPVWRGEAGLAGRTVLLHAESGLGDTIQFCRYAREVAARGATVLLEVPPALKTLLSGLDGVSAVVVRGEVLPAFDWHCPLPSLPLAFSTGLDSVPSPARLRIAPARRDAWRARLAGEPGPRVGLVWAGSARHRDDAKRAVPLTEFIRVMVPGVRFVSLQRGPREADRAVLESCPELRRWGDALDDLADTAALIDALDLVITADTCVAHLAGSLGKPVWVVLPVNANWRWLLDREDSPWYPTARLFRQAPVDRGWSRVVDRVRLALAVALAGGHPPFGR